MADVSENFLHAPLDRTTQSIRVAQILPDLTSEGLIQCLVTHTTIEADYTCLSYVWGPPEPCQTIIINGKPFVVRQNLFDFLCNVRTMVTPTNRSWIDAICIDQANVLERNHQVQQMGLIYSKARCVYIWLGKLSSTPCIEKLVQPSLIVRLWSSNLQSYRQKLAKSDIFQNEYWNRAWITQEILLARHVNVVLRSTILNFRDFLIAVGYPIGPRIHSHEPGQLDDYYYHRGTDAKSREAVAMLAPLVSLKPSLLKPQGDPMGYLPDARLISLLDSLRQTQCAVARDRIFSLLSLCDEGNSIRVDYSVSDKDLAYEILKRCGDMLCMCSIWLVGNRLSIFEAEQKFVPGTAPFLEVDVSAWAYLDPELNVDQIPVGNPNTHLVCLDPTLEYDRPLFDGKDCLVLHWIMHQLKISSTPTPNYTHTQYAPSCVDESIQTSNCQPQEDCKPKRNLTDAAEKSYDANGFLIYKLLCSKDAQSYHRVLRISLELVWSLLRDAPGNQRLCLRFLTPTFSYKTYQRRVILGP
jgi:hypothetical protein